MSTYEGRRSRSIVLLLMFFALCLPGTAQGLDRVVLQLRWDHQFQFAGYYAALWNGYYEEAGLDVEIRSAVKPDGTILNAVDEVVQGRADFGIGSTDILIARNRGHELSVLACIFQQSPVAFFALEETTLQVPADLVRLRVARLPGDLTDIEMRAMLRAEGINPEVVTTKAFTVEGGYFDALLEGRVDVIPGYTTGTPHQAKTRGIALESIRPVDFGVNFYGDSLFASESLCRKNPELVQRFRNASLRGWRFAVAFPGGVTHRIVEDFEPAFPVEDYTGFVISQISEVIRLTQYPVVDMGHVNPHRWRMIHDQLREIGMLSGEPELEDFIFNPDQWEEEADRRLLRRLLLALAVGGVLSLFGLIWTLTLRRRVRTRTAELTREVEERRRVQEALAESEQRFRTLMEFTWDWEYWLDPDGGVVYVSPSCERITGYRAEEFMSDPGLFVSIVHPDYREEFVRHVHEDRHQGRVLTTEFPIQRKDGGQRWVSHICRPVLGEQGENRGTRASNRDVTEQKNLEVLREDVERIMRHDIKSPLTGIGGLASVLLRAENLDDKQRNFVKLIQESSRKVLFTVSSSLDYLKMERGTYTLEPGICDLVEILETTRAGLMDLTEDRGVDIDIVLPDQEERDDCRGIRAERDHIETLFQNLVRNAAEAAPPGTRVKVRLGRGPDLGMGESCEVSVHNLGAVPEAIRGRFFEKYVTHGKRSGTGLGTYSARLIARAHGGDVELDTSDETGTTVIVRLPLNTDRQSVDHTSYPIP